VVGREQPAIGKARLVPVIVVIVIVMSVVVVGVIMRMIVVSGRSSHCPDPL
jgi:hypothetical protein